MLTRQRLLSQNFLKSPELVAKLVAMAKFTKSDLVIDIGAGTGSISIELAKTCGQVVGVEIDERLINTLRSNLARFTNVNIVHSDIRSFELPEKPYKVFSNLPFHITAEITYKLLYGLIPPKECYLVMQKEAAQKFAGLPTETQFSLLAKPYFDFKIMWDFKKSDFVPEPDVDCVLLKITTRDRALLSEIEKDGYASFIKYAFGTWKKDLKVGLKKVFTYKQWKRLAKDNHFNVHAKPTDLTFAQWLNLFRFYEKIKV